MTEITIFAGPTIGACATTVLPENCTLLAPVSRGDVDRLVRERPVPGIIAVVDGHIERALSVSHGELCRALDKGWRIWGLGDMGAIRAYELRHEGMKGYGRTYGYFTARADFRDDEVVWSYAPDPPYPLFSEPLIHFREAVRWLRRTEHITPATGRRLIADLEKTWFKARTLARFNDLLRNRCPALPDNMVNGLLGSFHRFRVKLHDFEAFLSEQPWRES